MSSNILSKKIRSLKKISSNKRGGNIFKRNKKTSTNIKPGVYASIDKKWVPLRKNQAEAYLNALSSHQMAMYTMGGPGPRWGDQLESGNTGPKYRFKFGLEHDIKDDVYIQLGDRYYHKIMNIEDPKNQAEYIESHFD